MSLALLISTFGRKALLDRVLAHIEAQTRLPDEVIVSAPDQTHIGTYRPRSYRLTHLFGSTGLTAQRNRALDAAVADHDIISFFDDDFLAANNYLEVLEASFRKHPDWTVITGKVLRDGITGAGLDFEEGLAILRRFGCATTAESKVCDRHAGYGCNMSMRACDIGALRFDERLALYGWQEDVDFTRRVARGGRIVELTSLTGVHLGIKAGRNRGVQFGYSQIANPVYLASKGTLPVRFATLLMARNLAANLVRSLWPEPYIDRFGRLKGNALAIRHVISGRIEPEFILKL
jgi:GT2 family glycosyltransferase